MALVIGLVTNREARDRDQPRWGSSTTRRRWSRVLGANRGPQGRGFPGSDALASWDNCGTKPAEFRRTTTVSGNHLSGEGAGKRLRGGPLTFADMRSLRLKAPYSTTELTARQGILRGQTGLTIDSEAVRAGPWDRLGQPVPIDLGNRLRGGPRARPLRTVFDNATGEHLRGVVEGC